MLLFSRVQGQNELQLGARVPIGESTQTVGTVFWGRDSWPHCLWFFCPSLPHSVWRRQFSHQVSGREQPMNSQLCSFTLKDHLEADTMEWIILLKVPLKASTNSYMFWSSYRPPSCELLAPFAARVFLSSKFFSIQANCHSVWYSSGDQGCLESLAQLWHRDTITLRAVVKTKWQSLQCIWCTWCAF